MNGAEHPADLETPSLLVDAAVLQRNIDFMAGVARRHGVALRPHAKTHKSTRIGRMQLSAGACGLTVATLAEAECMIAAGVEDLVLAYPPIGEWRVSRLGALLERARITVAIDNEAGVAALSALGARLARPIGYYWEVDSGLRRLGTLPGKPTAAAVIAASRHPRTEFRGLMTHAGHAYAAASPEELRRVARAEGELTVATANLLARRGVDVPVVSVGSTPTARVVAAVDGVTEIRPGTYVYNDATQVSLGVATVEECALSVLTTVVSRPAAGRIVVDAGSKALPKESLSSRTNGFGIVVGQPALRVERLYEEHGVLAAVNDESAVAIGHRLRIIPNHACTTSNLYRKVYLLHGDSDVEELEIGCPADIKANRS